MKKLFIQILVFTASMSLFCQKSLLSDFSSALNEYKSNPSEANRTKVVSIADTIQATPTTLVASQKQNVARQLSASGALTPRSVAMAPEADADIEQLVETSALSPQVKAEVEKALDRIEDLTPQDQEVVKKEIQIIVSNPSGAQQMLEELKLLVNVGALHELFEKSEAGQAVSPQDIAEVSGIIDEIIAARALKPAVLKAYTDPKILKIYNNVLNQPAAFKQALIAELQEAAAPQPKIDEPVKKEQPSTPPPLPARPPVAQELTPSADERNLILKLNVLNKMSDKIKANQKITPQDIDEAKRLITEINEFSTKGIRPEVLQASNPNYPALYLKVLNEKEGILRKLIAGKRAGLNETLQIADWKDEFNKFYNDIKNKPVDGQHYQDIIEKGHELQDLLKSLNIQRDSEEYRENGAREAVNRLRVVVGNYEKQLKANNIDAITASEERKRLVDALKQLNVQKEQFTAKELQAFKDTLAAAKKFLENEWSLVVIDELVKQVQEAEAKQLKGITIQPGQPAQTHSAGNVPAFDPNAASAVQISKAVAPGGTLSKAYEKVMKDGTADEKQQLLAIFKSIQAQPNNKVSQIQKNVINSQFIKNLETSLGQPQPQPAPQPGRPTQPAQPQSALRSVDVSEKDKADAAITGVLQKAYDEIMDGENTSAQDRIALIDKLKEAQGNASAISAGSANTMSKALMAKELLQL